MFGKDKYFSKIFETKNVGDIEIMQTKQNGGQLQLKLQLKIRFIFILGKAYKKIVIYNKGVIFDRHTLQNFVLVVLDYGIT